jgi:hypothetical protein
MTLFAGFHDTSVVPIDAGVIGPFQPVHPSLIEETILVASPGENALSDAMSDLCGSLTPDDIAFRASDIDEFSAIRLSDRLPIHVGMRR